MRMMPEAHEIATAFEVISGRTGDTFARASRAPRTWLEYARIWNRFERWCARSELQAMPAATETITRWLRELAASGRGVATLSTYAAAVQVAHRLHGHAINRDAIREELAGIRRLCARPPRQARPILRDELTQLLAMLDTRRCSDLRDRAIISLGWAMAGRQSEIVGLDFHRTGRGTGYARLEQQGILVQLTRSKTTGPVRLVIPAADMPTAIAALRAWTEAARLKPGDPVFVPVRGRVVGQDRLAPDAVSKILKQRVRELFLTSGRVSECAEAVQATSGHSLRSGLLSAMAMSGVREALIRDRARHRSANTTAGYIRRVAEWGETGLAGVGV
jgi:integrase